MMPQIYEAIEKAIASGVPHNQLSPLLSRQGWPPALVNEAINAWLLSHGRAVKKTEFTNWLKKYKRQATPYIFIVLIFGLISSAIMLLKPWPVKILVDSVFGSLPAPGPLKPYTGTPSLILITSLLTVAIFVVGSIFGTIRDYVMLQLSYRLDKRIKSDTLRHILFLPLYHKQRLDKGDYIYRQNVLTGSMSELVLGSSSAIAQSVITVCGILVIMFLFNPLLTLISVLVIPFLFVLIRIFSPQLGKIARALSQIASKVSAGITESIDNAETVQSFNLEQKQLNKAQSLWNESHKLSKRGLLWGKFYRSSNGLLIILGTSAVMYFGGTAVLRGEITVGQLLIFIAYMGYLLGPIESLAMQIATRNQKLIDVSRVYEVMTDHENVEDLRKQNHFPFIAGRIEFQNVSYTYNDAPVLKNINLMIEPGQKIGIIGPSGGGKSTLLKLLPLFVEPTQGRILIDNVDTQTVSLKELRQQIVWISQSPQLFNETVLENLINGNLYRQITPEEIESAIAAANVNEFIKKLPMGMDTPTGEGGSSLSGGQKQRIAIARGLLKNAPIICMDEPTAALDSKSENTIKEALPQLLEKKTVLLVTHRKALLSLMEKIYVMENGELRDVNDYGGLEKYLAEISGINEPDDALAAELERNQSEQENVARQRLASLEAENAKLQQEVQSVTPVRQNSDGTLYIEH